MSNRLKTSRHLLLSCSALFPVLLAASPAHPQAVNLGGAGNFIAPDGATQTSVTNSGNVTDVRTGTVRGDVGFNSFSRFEAGAGNTVNLHLAPNTGTLVNVVRDAPVVVEGTVNALKNGTIGGNVVFSDPYGFVLGKDGVINTGGLTLNTPTREFIDGAIGRDGRIDTGKTDRLISGDVPISPDGSVVIRGRVNAQTHIDIHANSIDIDPEAKLRRHRENFEASVNTQGGASQGAALVVRDGRIQLVATGDVRVGGSLAARATSRESAANGAGRVAIRAGGNVTVTPTARIEALVAIAREQGPEAVAAIVGIEAGQVLDIAGDVRAIGEGGAGANVNLAGDRIAVKAGALIASQIEAGARSASVEVAAARDASFEGRIEALGAAGTKGGRVNIRAGEDIVQGAASSIDASGVDGSAGGDIYVVATRDLSVADGATVTARGSGNADGGFAELSGYRAVSLGAGKVDLRSAGSGKAGTLLIDPEELVVTSGASLTSLANTVFEATKSITIRDGGAIRSASSNGTAFDISLRAPTITVESGGTIDSRVLDANGIVAGNSGSILLQGSTIDLQKGSVVRADAAGSFTAGDVTLLATSAVLKNSGISTARATITIGGTVLGRDISALAVATASAKWNEVDFLNEDFEFATTTSLLAIPQILARFGSLPLAIDGGLNFAESTATVSVTSDATITATRDLDLAAVGTQVAANLGMNPTSGAAVQIGVFAGVVSAETAVRVASGANLTVARDLTVTAQNSATLSVNAFNLGLKDTPITGAIAVAVADIDTEASIASGAIVTVGGKVRVAADNLNSFEAVATGMALQDGVAGAAVAVQHHDAKVTAALDATISGVGGQAIGDVTVSAVSETVLNRTAASTTLGDNALIRLVRNKVGVSLAEKATTKFPSLSAFMRNAPIGALAQDEMPKGAVAFAIGVGTQEAVARIGDSVTINSAGNVAVVSNVLDSQVRANADVSIGSAEEKGDGPKTTTGVGIAINIAEFDHRSRATVGTGANITAANFGLAATSLLPINIAYQNAKTPLDWIMAIKNAVNGNLGVVKNILTSYAASEVTSENTGIGASINYLGLGHDVLSWVGAGASITTTDTDAGTWNAAVRIAAADGSVVGREPGRIGGTTFDKGVDISAKSLTETINIAGNPAWLIVIGGNASTSPEGRSLGGSFSLTSFDAKTVAGIGAGASVVSAGDLAILAERTDTVFTVAPSAGGGAGFGISGILAMTMIDNNTAAAIDSGAVISAASVALNARQHSQIVSIAGALNAGNGVNVGLSANWSNILTKTRAFVGDTDDLVSGALANAVRTPGSITTDALTVNAKTTGDIYALSVTAAISMPNDGEKGRVDKVKDSISGFVGGRADKHNAFAKANEGLLGKLSGKVGGLLGDVAPAIAAKPTPAGQKPQFSLAAAGSVTGSTLGMKTAAFLDGADVKRLAGTGAVGVSIDALNDTLISVTSGAASIALVGQDSAKSSGAVAGAVAVAVTDNDVYAGIRNSTLTNVGTTSVRALSSGQQIVLGLGLAVNTNANSAYSLAGSVSFGFVFDNVKAEIADTTLSATGVDSDVSVKAYQNTDIGIGGLAVSVATSGAGGFGLALTGTVIADTADPLGDPNAKAVSATISNSSMSGIRNATVDAATLSRVLSGAGSVGVAPNGLGFTGAIVFNDIAGSTYAAITGNANHKIDASGNVLVRSGATRTAAIATELGDLIRNTAVASGFDFSANVLDTDTTGSVILAVAGAVGVGKNSAGFSILYNGVRHKHEALVQGATIEADGEITVAATDETKIIGTAAGVSVATGEFGGAGSIVVQVVKNTTSATVDGASLTGSDVSVLASNTSFIAGGAGAVGIGASAQGTGLGLSLVSGAIANSTSASVKNAATLVADGTDRTKGNVLVDATSSGWIVTTALSVGVGGTVGIAGSIATSVAANDVAATVADSAVTAENNVAVQSENADRIHAAAGAVGVSLKAAGVGLSTLVNVVRGTTVAAVDRSTIVARGTGDGMLVDNGVVATDYAYSIENFGKSLVLIDPNLSNGTRSVSGFSIGAHSKQKVSSASLAVAVGINVDTLVSVAGAVSPVVNVLGGKTEARLADSSVNTADAANAEADVAVLASSNTFAQNFVVAAAGSTGGAGAGGFVSNVMERDTNAIVSGSTIGAGTSVRDVEVAARAYMDSSSLVAGLSVGPIAAAGSMVVNVFDAATKAQLTGGTLTARALNVTALTDTGFLGVAGSGAGGSTAVAGAFNVSVNLGSTSALVGDGDRDTTLVLGEDLRVDAKTVDEQRAFVVGGAVGVGGGGAAVAGMLNLSVLMSDTTASVNRLTASSMRNVEVTANHDVRLLPVTGGFGISVDGVGVGAAANVMLTKSAVAAEVLNSTFTARGTLKVEATASRKIDMVTATLGAGGTAGIGASIGIIVAGIGMTEDAEDELGDTLGAANRQNNQSVGTTQGEDYTRLGAGSIEDESGTGQQKITTNELKRRDVVSSAVNETKRDSVTARIAGGAITAGATTVLADSKVETTNVAFGAGIGGAVGVGAALGFTIVNQDVSASIDGTHSLASLSVRALSRAIDTDPALSVKAYAGAGALAGALGAAVAVAHVESDVKARAAGSQTVSGPVLIEAKDELAVQTEAVGATAAGGVAIGISLALSNRDADVTAEIGDSAIVTGASGVDVNAFSTGSSTAKAVAGAGGLLGAGVGASATALDSTSVVAKLGTGADLASIGTDGVGILAQATPKLSAESIGVAVAGTGAVGASVAVAKSTTVVNATIGANAGVASRGGLSVNANLLRNGDSLHAKSVAGAGALYLAAQASVSQALMNGRVNATVGDNVEIDTRTVSGSAETGRGDVEVSATSETRQNAETTGVAVSLGLSLGATVAEAKSDVETRASIGANSDVRARNLSILATGDNMNVASSVAGGGGLVSGSAAVVTTDNRSVVAATLGGGTANDKVALTGTLTVNASHLAGVGGSVNSINAGVVGASGARAQHSVSSTVDAAIAANARVEAGDLAMAAMNRTHRLFAGESASDVNLQTGQSSFNGDGAGWNLDSGSGGLVNLPAGESRMTIAHTTRATVGDNAHITLDGTGQRSKAAISAGNEIIVHDKVRLDSGGAIATADTRTYLNVTTNEAKVGLGVGATLLLPNGNVALAAYDNAHIDLRAASTTYGLAGAPTGHAQVDYNRSNLVETGAGALIEANSRNDASAGNIAIAAGASLGTDLATSFSRVTARATVDLFNKTAIPIPTVPNPLVDIRGDSSIRIAESLVTGKGVRAAGDIALTATRGLIQASAVGTGKDIYREGLATIVNGIASLFGVDNVTFDYKGGATRLSGLGSVDVDGLVETGISRTKSLTIRYDSGTCALTSLCLTYENVGDIGYTDTQEATISTAIFDRIAALEDLMRQYASDPVALGAYRAEIDFLKAKLNALNLAEDGKSYIRQSEYEEALATLDLYLQVLPSLGRNVGTNAAAVVTGAGNIKTSGTTLKTESEGAANGAGSLKTALDGIDADLRGLKNYGGGNAAANAGDFTAIGLANTAITTNKDVIDGANTAIATQQGIIDGKLTSIGTTQGQITAKRAQIDNPPAGTTPAQLRQYRSELVALEKSLATDSAAVIDAQKLIDAEAVKIRDATTAIDTALDTIVSKRQAIRDRSKDTATENNADTARLGRINAVLVTGDTRATVKQDSADARTQVTTIGTNVGTAAQKTSFTDYQKGADELTAQQTLVDSGDLDDEAGNPTTKIIEVADTSVRLGSIRIEADKLTGSGELSAPGDAAIRIENHTSNSLVVNDLTIDSNNGGRITLNGATANTLAELQSLTAGTEKFTGTYRTAHTQGASAQPTIEIKNLYNSDNAAYFDESKVGTANAPLHLTQKRFAPDLTIKGAVVNERGLVSVSSQQGNIYVDGTIDAGSMSIVAKNGDFVQRFSYDTNHISGDPFEGKVGGLGLRANGAISISARYINVNGLIRSGLADRQATIATDAWMIAPTDYALDGTETGKANTFRDRANKIAGDWVELSSGVRLYYVLGGTYEVRVQLAKADAQPGRTYQVITSEMAASPTDESLVGVTYNSTTKQFEVEGTSVRGGHIELYGQILSTGTIGNPGHSGAHTSAGRIEVLDGFGQIIIDNKTTRELVVGKLDTGEDLSGTGRGKAGYLKITDIRNVATGVDGRPVEVWITEYSRELRNGGLTALSKVTKGALDTEGNFVAGTFSGSTFTAAANQTQSWGTGRGHSYSPQQHLRYVTQTGTDGSLVEVYALKSTQWLGNSAWLTGTNVERTKVTAYRNEAERLDNGQVVVIDRKVDGSGNTIAVSEVSNTISGTKTSVVSGQRSTCNWATLCVTQTHTATQTDTTAQTIITSTSRQADFAIAVAFIGADTGTVNVKSLGSILLSGQVNNQVGSTTIKATAGDIVQAQETALIKTTDLTLEASGSVGSTLIGGAIETRLANGGKLNGSAGAGNFVVNSETGIGVGVVEASGNALSNQGRVILSASGSITGDANSRIQAPRVELTSRYGSVGSTSNLLTVNTGFAEGSANRPFGDPATTAGLNGYYGLKVTAAGDIGIEAESWSGNAEGTILVDRVVSAGGSVKLSTPGAILDNNPIQSIDTRTWAELVAYWNTLGLTASDANTAKVGAVIAAFERQIATEKRFFDQMQARNGSSVYDADFAFAMTEAEKLGLAASLRLSGDMTDAEVDAAVAQYELDQTKRYHAFEATRATLSGSFGADGTYVASAAEKDARSAGSTWTQRELAFSVSAGALKTITGTNPVLKASNVSGREVTLVAGKGLGEVSGVVEIPIGIDPSQLTDAQKVALATAERSDFQTRGDGDPIRISAIRMLNVDAVEKLNVAVSGANANAYLASQGDIRFGSVVVPGELRVKVRGSITNASGADALSAGSYILEASGGGIGWSRAENGDFIAGSLRLKPVNTGLGTNGRYRGAIIARAAETVDLDVEGDANVDTVYSRKDIAIGTDGDIRNAIGNDLINILGRNVSLTADGSIGASGRRLNIGNGLEGLTSADAGGSIHLFAPDGNHLSLGDLVARGGVIDVLAGNTANASSAGDILVAGKLQAATNALLKATGSVGFGPAGSVVLANGNLSIDAASLRMLEGSGANVSGTIAVETNGDAQVTNLVAGANDAAAITIDAGGRILAGTAAGRVDLKTSAANGGVVLNAGLGIGDRRISNVTLADETATDVLNHLRIDAAHLDVTSGGAIAIEMLRNVAASSFEASGNVDLVAGAKFVSSLVRSTAGSVAIAAVGETVIASIEAAKDVTFDGQSEASLAVVESGGSQGLTAVGNLSFGALTATAGDIGATSKTGSVGGTSANAGGLFAANAQRSITVDTIGAGTSVTLGAGEAIDVRETDAGTTVTANAGTTLEVGRVTSGGSQGLAANGDLSFGSLAATAGDIEATSKTGSVGGTTVNAGGLFAANAQRSITVNTIGAGTSVVLGAGDAIDVRETDAGVTVAANAGTTLVVGRVTSGGSQGLTANGDLTFGALTSTAGDIEATSKTGSVGGTSVNAGGLFAANARRSITVDTIGTGTSVSLGAGEAIDVRETDAGTSVTANAGTTLAAGRITSGGSQGLTANGDLSFGALTATTGDIEATSKTGSVGGTSVNAGGLFAASAKRSITVDTIGTGTSVSLGAGEAIDVREADAGTSVTADAGTTLTSARITSGGSQSLTANGDLVFGFLKSIGISSDPADIALLSRTGSVLGGMAGTVNAASDLSIEARFGLTFDTLTAGRDMRIRIGGDLEGRNLEVGRQLDLWVGGTKGVSLGSISGRDLTLSTGGPLSVQTVVTSERAGFHAPELRVGKLVYTGNTVLGLDVTGFEGAIADFAQLDIEAPAIAMNRLFATDSRFRTNAFSITLADGRVPGSMEWLTPWRTVWMNNRLQQPVLGHDVQLYQPSGSFAFDQLGNRTATTSYVVRYGLGSNIHELFSGKTYLGASFIRNFEAALQDPSNDLPGLEGRERSMLQPNFEAMMNRLRLNGTGSVTGGVGGPAVNLGDQANEDEDEAVLEEAALR